MTKEPVESSRKLPIRGMDQRPSYRANSCLYAMYPRRVTACVQLALADVVRAILVRTANRKFILRAGTAHLGTSRNRNQCRPLSNNRSSGRFTKGTLLLLLRYRPNQDDRNPALLDRDER